MSKTYLVSFGIVNQAAALALCRPWLLFFLLEGTPARRSFAPDVPRARTSSAALDGRKSRAGRRQHGRCRTFLCESPTTQSPVLGASMPHVPFLGCSENSFFNLRSWSPRLPRFEPISNT